MHEELFEELRREHREVISLINRMLEINTGAERHKNLEVLLQKLLPHMVGEEQIIYPSLRQSSEAWSDARESIREHQKAQQILEELASTSPDDSRFQSRLGELKEKLEHHVREEESRIFADLERVVDEREAKKLLDSFRKEKDLAKTRYPDIPIRSASEHNLRV